jgi:hypothetical protein
MGPSRCVQGMLLACKGNTHTPWAQALQLPLLPLPLPLLLLLPLVMVCSAQPQREQLLRLPCIACPPPGAWQSPAHARSPSARLLGFAVVVDAGRAHAHTARD